MKDFVISIGRKFLVHAPKKGGKPTLSSDYKKARLWERVEAEKFVKRYKRNRKNLPIPGVMHWYVGFLEDHEGKVFTVKHYRLLVQFTSFMTVGSEWTDKPESLLPAILRHSKEGRACKLEEIEEIFDNK